MTHDHAARIARAGREAADAGLGALLVTPGPDLVYLIGYDAPELERLTVLVARPSGPPVLVVPELERPRAEASPGATLAEIETWPDGEDPYELVARVLGAPSACAVSDRMWAAHLIGLQRVLPDTRVEAGSRVLARLRSRKDPGEVQLLARAARSADETYRRILREGLQGRAEEDVARSLQRHLIDSGHESVAFSIVASGPNAASPHHLPGGRGIRRGDALVMDFGGRVGGYCSDITRTASVGAPSPRLEEIHQVVREAQESAFRAVRPGVSAQDIDRAAREVIDDAGYGGAFVHRTGHGIGLEEHEEPYLVAGNQAPLEPGMCFSIEPGIYLAGELGVRIEDIVTVTDEGGERLNHAPRELVVVG